jgi:nitroreductase
MDVIEAIHGRRSVRSYKSKPVERALIECLILDAAEAPPPFHGQIPWVFNVFEGIERIAAYGARAMEYARNHRPEGPGWGCLDRPDFEIFGKCLL